MTRHRLTALLLLCAACAGESTPPTAAATSARLSQAGLGSDVNRELASLRRATAPLHDVAAAARAGWSAPITGCMDNGSAGAMGVHVGRPSLINNAEVIVDQPELLMYEPGPNGTMRLVGVEYIIPYSYLPRSATPPVLFGREFARVDGFQLWGLHVWAWAENPVDMFAPWNPRVSCQYAEPMSATHQH